MPELHSANTVCLIRPMHFAFNPETAGSNIFQEAGVSGSARLAAGELTALATSLDQAGIDCIVLEDRKDVLAPDAVFPNNWFSTHPDGTVVLYPLLSPLRRAERRADLFETVLPAAGFLVKRIVDFTSFEARGRYLEGTGSLVFDHASNVAYACLSSRTDRDLAIVAGKQLGVEVVCFEATIRGREVYHTNVLMSIGSRISILCRECIPDPARRNIISEKLEASGKILLDISPDQVFAFAANVLELQNKQGHSITAISSTALHSLRPEQIALLEKHTRLLEVSLPVIEKIGGGSVRCMMAEIFLPKK